MKQYETALSFGLQAVTYILTEDALRERFLTLSGLSSGEIRTRIEKPDFLASALEFLINHDPDLIAFAESLNESPKTVVAAWRSLGGGVGQEW